ncbi:MAG: hypothetical protein V1917_01720 [Candidatus Gottesmanbacteria bacterium]
MKSDRDLFLISLFTFVTVLSWIFFELAKTTKTSTVTPTVNQIITPLTPTLDTGTLDMLEQKIKL